MIERTWLDFYNEVCRRSERAILKGQPITGAHHRAMEEVKKEWENAKTK